MKNLKKRKLPSLNPKVTIICPYCKDRINKMPWRYLGIHKRCFESMLWDDIAADMYDEPYSIY